MQKMISVIMANYNTPIEYLRESVESILSQSYADFEFIIVDDASTDESIHYIENIRDDRIVIIRNSQNLGLTKSLNKGLRLAQGKYIARMDSDDIALPTRFEEQVKFMEQNPDVIVCGTWFEKFGVEQQVRRPIINNFEEYRCQLLFGNTPITLCHPSAIMRKEMLDQYGIEYDERCKKAQDYQLWTICSKYGRISILEKVLLKYRTHSKQISISSCGEQTRFVDEICNQQLSELGVNKCEQLSRWRRTEVESIEEFENYYKWLQLIKENNRKRNLYQQQILELYLDRMALRGIRGVAGKNYIWKLFVKREFSIMLAILKMRIKTIC